MRGKAAASDGAAVSARITPAHAGKGMQVARSCTLSGGSPPRMRGKDQFARACLEGVGITPAHAGKGSCKRWRSSFSKDHPRACGERTHWLPLSVNVPGSPPRMRGKGFGKAHHEGVVGITPAHAGKGPALAHIFRTSRDHPRACGERCCF